MPANFGDDGDFGRQSRAMGVKSPQIPTLKLKCSLTNAVTSTHGFHSCASLAIPNRTRPQTSRPQPRRHPAGWYVALRTSTPLSAQLRYGYRVLALHIPTTCTTTTQVHAFQIKEVNNGHASFILSAVFPIYILLGFSVHEYNFFALASFSLFPFFFSFPFFSFCLFLQ